MTERIHYGNAGEYATLIPAEAFDYDSVVIRTNDLTKPDEYDYTWKLYASKRHKKPLGTIPGNIGSGEVVCLLNNAGIKALHV